MERIEARKANEKTRAISSSTGVAVRKVNKPAPRQKAEKPVPAVTAEEKKAADQDLSADELAFLEFLSQHPGMFVTRVYKALQLSGYKGDRLKKELIEKGLVSQEETREGRKGRLAKVLTVTDKAASILRNSPPSGKGGDFHKQLQSMIKEQAELYGWKAKIEERIRKSLESVDVGLQKDDVRVAVEISSTSGPLQEIGNIRKCLEAGYDYVLSVCPDEESLSLLKREARKRFILKERERVRFSLPSQVKTFLSSLTPSGIVSENPIVSAQISEQKELLGTREASEFLGISRNTLYEWIAQRKVPHLKVGRLVKFRKEDLESWLRQRTQAEDKRDFV